MIVRHRSPLSPFDRNVDRAFEQIANSFFDTRRHSGPVVNGGWQDRDGAPEYVLTVDLPGVPAEAVSLEVRANTLTLGAATESMEWQRSLRLGGRLDPEKVSANYVDGRLTVRVGTYDEPEARAIAIDTTPAPAAIEATADEIGDDEPVTPES